MFWTIKYVCIHLTNSDASSRARVSSLNIVSLKRNSSTILVLSTISVLLRRVPAIHYVICLYVVPRNRSITANDWVFGNNYTNNHNYQATFGHCNNYAISVGQIRTYYTNDSSALMQSRRKFRLTLMLIPKSDSYILMQYDSCFAIAYGNFVMTWTPGIELGKQNLSYEWKLLVIWVQASNNSVWSE